MMALYYPPRPVKVNGVEMPAVYRIRYTREVDRIDTVEILDIDTGQQTVEIKLVTARGTELRFTALDVRKGGE